MSYIDDYYREAIVRGLEKYIATPPKEMVDDILTEIKDARENESLAFGTHHIANPLSHQVRELQDKLKVKEKENKESLDSAKKAISKLIKLNPNDFAIDRYGDIIKFR
jgi:hypothetical protein